MPYVTLSDLLNLLFPNKQEVQCVDEMLLSDKFYDDPLDRRHMRYEHVSKSKLIKGFRHILITVSGLTRSHLSKGFTNSIASRHLCKA